MDSSITQHCRPLKVCGHEFREGPVNWLGVDKEVAEWGTLSGKCHVEREGHFQSKQYQLLREAG